MSKIIHTVWLASGERICQTPDKSDYVKIDGFLHDGYPCEECMNVLKRLAAEFPIPKEPK